MQASVAADHIHSSDHNLDIDEYRKSLKNVDYSRTSLNEVLVAEPLRDLYDREFGDALAAYNARQKRKDRRIESYYDHVSASSQEKLCYEVIVQIGDRDNNSALNAANRERSGDVYRDYLERFREKYGHVLKVFEAAIHYDEETPHMHLAFVPVVENHGKNGLAVKNSFRQAMQELGIENGRAVEFFHGAHEMLAEVMEDHGIEKTASRYDRANRGDMTQEEYVEFSRNQEKLIESRERLAECEKDLSRVKHEIGAALGKRNDLQRGNQRLESVQRRIAGQVREARAEAREARSEEAEARREAEAWLQTSEILHQQANREEARRDEALSEAAEARGEASRLSGEVSDLKSQKADLEREVAELKLERRGLSSDRDSLKSERDELSIEVDGLRHERGLLESAVEKLKEVADKIIDRLRPYLPNPIIVLARAFRDDDEQARERWHDAMDDTAWDIAGELPSRFAEMAMDASLVSESMRDHAVATKDKNAKRDEWSI